MMTRHLVSRSKAEKLTIPLLLIGAAILVAGCGEPEKPAMLVSETTQTYDKAVTLSGTVRDQKGQVTEGTVVATDATGSTLARATLGDDNRYAILIPAGTALPIVLNAYPGAEGSEGKPLKVVIVESSLKTYEINPLTTAIAEKAKSLGGYTRQNVTAATMMSVSTPDEDKTSAGFRGDPTKHYGGWH